MTEQDYIIVSDLQRAKEIQRLLSDILPENNKTITRESKTQVARIVAHWVESLFSEAHQRIKR